MTKIDINSPEFQEQLSKTIKFTDGVIKQFNWVYNPQAEVNEGVQLGLARNKMMYGKYFCPCFMVETVDGKAKSVDDRICPCKPAIEKEIPEDGVCHCGIYCTPEYAEKKANELKGDEIVHTHSRGLSKDEAKVLLESPELDGESLVALLEARELKMVDFRLVDVREPMEWDRGHIEGADELVPTSNFFASFEAAEFKKDEHIVLYCHVGSRSAHCARILRNMGFSKITNLTYGIVAYPSTIVR
ncbi:MAG: ferredoxin-thioredoxin reductase catalytic domain-containing protein [Sulfurimonas sp.]|jgi:rhodanese-related sulfurtransferase/ferredoxin-thioredoxin reductase catalytic subunit|nr:ferredoxin-thioredoxin reductase catalytic domain-containing protein [Sulfurimonadaceae bacterium]